MKINYQLLTDKEIEGFGGRVPRLLLHSCCGPCSSYVLEYLSKYFYVTVLFFNPNIYPKEEYMLRLENQKKLLDSLPTVHPIGLMDADYTPEVFESAVRGYEGEREGGTRCPICFRLRMEETARLAQKNEFEYFTTTLSVSPHKNAQQLNEIGGELSDKYGVKYLFSDFKKREGYKRSIELSGIYALYRQNYCGCRYSLGNVK